MALAQSMGDPPPKASTASGEKSRRARTPSATRRREGSGVTLLNTSVRAPLRCAVTRGSRPDLWARKSSVTMSTRFPASASRAESASSPK